MDFLNSKTENQYDIKHHILTPVKTINKLQQRPDTREVLKPIKKQRRRSHSNQITEELLNTTHRFTGRSVSIPTNARLRILNKLKRAEKMNEEAMISDLVAEDFKVTKPEIQIRQCVLKKIDKPIKKEPDILEQDSEDELPNFDGFLQRRKFYKPKLRFDMRLNELKFARMIERNIDQNDDDV